MIESKLLKQLAEEILYFLTFSFEDIYNNGIQYSFSEEQWNSIVILRNRSKSFFKMRKVLEDPVVNNRTELGHLNSQSCVLFVFLPKIPTFTIFSSFK